MSSSNGLRNRKAASAIEAESRNGRAKSPTGPRMAMSANQVAKDEKKKSKLIVRVISSFAMISVFGGCVLMGHLYVCGVVALAEVMLFRELVKVRYNAYFARVENTVPLFRTTQWAWFSVAIFYTYGDFISEVVQSNKDLHYLVPYAEYSKTIAFGWYAAVFVLTIATMQAGHVKFQLNQLCWTILVLCWTIGQMKYIMHNVFNGLIWFTLPFLLVCNNDVMAYFCGRAFGRKFIKRPFLWFSPNKTWEGFIGGGICTVIVAWFLSRMLAQFQWMTCPVNKFELFPGHLECPDNEIQHMFVDAQSVLPHQLFEMFPQRLVKMIPGIAEMCTVDDGALQSGEYRHLGPVSYQECIDGEDSHSFHHFELVVKNVYPIQIHALWLALFASIVAPFGGFLASAIKRAYGIKDFDSLIPGHGGFTDRFDCQFLMALCTWVHYNSFCRMTTINVPKLVYHYKLMSPMDKQEFLEAILPTDIPVDQNLLRQFQEYALSGSL